MPRSIRIGRMGDEIQRSLLARSTFAGAADQGMSSPTIVVVGNAMVPEDHGPMVDSARWVYRFNRLDNYGTNTGTKTDFWVLASHRVVLSQLAAAGGPAGAKGRIFRDVARTVQEMVFAVPCRFTPPSQAEHRVELAERAAAVGWFLGEIGSAHVRAAIHTYSRSTLAPLDPNLCSLDRPFPSNGYLTVASLVQRAAIHQCRIAMIGFTWEGWYGHPWQAEERALRSFVASGQLSIIE